MGKETKGFLFLLNTIILFSTYEAVSKTLVGIINPFQINFIRFLIGGLVLLVFVLMQGDAGIGGGDLARTGIIGILNVAISMNLLQLSLYESNAKASVVAVIFSSNPIFVTLFAVLFDKEKVNARKCVGLLIGLGGVAVVSLQKLQLDSSSLKSPVLALLSAFFYGLYTVLARRSSMKIGSLKMNAYSFLIGSLTLLPVLLFLKVPVGYFHTEGLVQVLFLSIVVSGLAYLTYFKGLAILGASRGSIVFFGKPVLASLIAIFFLREHGSWNLLAGTMLIIFGIFISIRQPAAAKSSRA